MDGDSVDNTFETSHSITEEPPEDLLVAGESTADPPKMEDSNNEAADVGKEDIGTGEVSAEERVDEENNSDVGKETKNVESKTSQNIPR